MTLRIDVDRLRLSYNDTTALDDVTFSLPGGRIYGLLGRNGSGKTSLLSVLAAFRKPSAGTALIDGQPVFENAAITSQICLVRETGDAADRSEKVNEALRIARRLRPDWDEDYAARLLDRFSLPLDKRIGDLSRGQRSAFGIVVRPGQQGTGDDVRLVPPRGWRHIVEEERLFGAPDQVLAIFATYWMLYAVWTLAGAMLAASFYREDGTVLVTLPAALVMVLGCSLAVGYLKVPVIGSYLERAELGAWWRWGSVPAACCSVAG